VRDHGIGIEPDVLPHVFELFMQAGPGIERADGGMGIGLTMVDRLVQLHGGTVEAHSAGGEHGSTFVVRIPLGHPETKRITSETEVVHTTPVRAVIVEDSADLRDLSCEMLEHFGCTVDSAATGPDGLELILRVEPEVAIVDIGLPGMDGLELARTLRTRSPELHTVLVAVTGYGRLEDHEAAIAAGFDLHFAKPIDADRLHELVDRIRAQRAA
jgi:two-component system, sensor histidine kinase